MFDFSWGEILTVGVVALLVIGPKDLPKTLRAVGHMTGKVKRMAGEFQSQFHDAMREADLDEARRSFTSAQETFSKGFNPMETIRNELKSSIEAPPHGEVYGPPRDPLAALALPDLPQTEPVVEPLTLAKSENDKPEAKA